MNLPDTRIMVVGVVILALIGGNVYFYMQSQNQQDEIDQCIAENATISTQCADEVDCNAIIQERNDLQTTVTTLEGTIVTRDETIVALTADIANLEKKLDKRDDAVVGVSSALGVIGLIAILGGGYFAFRKKE